MKPRDRLAFELEEDSVRLRVERRKTLEEFRGSLPANRDYRGKEAEREAARSHVVRKVLERQP